MDPTEYPSSQPTNPTSQLASVSIIVMKLCLFALSEVYLVRTAWEMKTWYRLKNRQTRQPTPLTIQLRFRVSQRYSQRFRSALFIAQTQNALFYDLRMSQVIRPSSRRTNQRINRVVNQRYNRQVIQPYNRPVCQLSNRA